MSSPAPSAAQPAEVSPQQAVNPSSDAANVTETSLDNGAAATAADDSGVAPTASPVASGPKALTLRALVSTKEAGVIIGKGGANVAELRDRSGVKAGVSKVVPGVHDRVLSVSGTLEGVAKVGVCRLVLTKHLIG